jgi:hypothetical protein
MATVKSKKELFEKIKNFSYNDLEKEVIVLGDLIEIRLNDDCLDIYKYKNLDNVDIEEYDFDSDYLTTIYY